MAKTFEYQGSPFPRVRGVAAAVRLPGKDPRPCRARCSHLETQRPEIRRYQFCRPRIAAPVRVQEILRDAQIRESIPQTLLSRFYLELLRRMDAQAGMRQLQSLRSE